MSVLTTYTACPDIQDRLDEVFAKVSPSRIAEKQMFTEFLLSNENRDGVLQEQASPGRGKKRTVEVVYRPRIPESEVGDSVAQVCTSTRDLGDTSAEYTIDEDGVSIDWKITLSDLANLCADNENYIAEQILDAMWALFRKLETKNMTQLTALIGNFDANEDNVAAGVKTTSTLFADGTQDPVFIEDIEFASENAGYPSAPVVIGWGDIKKAFTRLKASNCCADSGLNAAEFAANGNLSFVASKKITSAVTSPNFITTALGALQLLYYNEFMGPNGINEVNDGSYIQTVIEHPLLGVPIDYTAVHNCGTINFQLKLATKLVGMPTDMFCVGVDDLEGVTFVNEYTIVNP